MVRHLTFQLYIESKFTIPRERFCFMTLIIWWISNFLSRSAFVRLCRSFYVLLHLLPYFCCAVMMILETASPNPEHLRPTFSRQLFIFVNRLGNRLEHRNTIHFVARMTFTKMKKMIMMMTTKWKKRGFVAATVISEYVSACSISSSSSSSSSSNSSSSRSSSSSGSCYCCCYGCFCCCCLW